MQWNDRMVIKWLKFHLHEWQLVLLGWWDESDRPQNLIGIRYIFFISYLTAKKPDRAASGVWTDYF